MSSVDRFHPQLGVDPWQLVDALLFSVSHDLRSPLLSITLSADLLQDVAGALSNEHPGGLAVHGLRESARDMERMLQSLTLLSRARRQPFERVRGPLGLILGGHTVSTEVADLASRVVAIDPLTVRDLLDDVAGEGPIQVQAAVEGAYVSLSTVLALPLSSVGSPLHTLASSLQAHAGGPLERLAVAQVLLERQGGSLTVNGGRLQVWLPLESAL